VNHPLWQRRFLASDDREHAFSFYADELMVLPLPSHQILRDNVPVAF
jgi:hypothetical protein